MNDAVAAVLATIVERYGVAVTEDSRRVEGLLRDLSGEHRREISVLVSAVQEGVVADLVAARGTATAQLLLPRLASRLEDGLGLAEASARWAVETWAVALGMSVAIAPLTPDVRVHPADDLRPCVSCGLSVSANAGFCRRCGARQG